MTRQAAPAAEAARSIRERCSARLAGARGLVLAVSGGPGFDRADAARRRAGASGRRRWSSPSIMGCGRRRPRRRGSSRENAAAPRPAVADHAGAGAARARQSAGLGAARALSLPRRGGARGRLRHDRDRASSGRPGRDVPAAAGARLGRLRPRRHGGGGASSTASRSRGRCSAFRARRSREIAAASGLPIVADPSNARSRASTASACAR